MNTRIGSKEKQAKFSVSAGKTHELLRNYMTSEYENPMVISFLYIKQYFESSFQKQLPEVFYEKRCS